MVVTPPSGCVIVTVGTTTPGGFGYGCLVFVLGTLGAGCALDRVVWQRRYAPCKAAVRRRCACMCMNVCMYVYEYVFLYVCVYIYIYMCIYIYI